MIKRIFVIAAMCLCFMPAFAQKNSIVLGNTTGSSSVNIEWVEKMRSSILAGLTSTGRLRVIDGSTLDNLSSVTSEAIQQMKNAGERYYLEATLETITTSHKYYNSGTTYYAQMEYSYKLYDVSSGTLLSGDRISHRGMSFDGTTDAIVRSVSLVQSDIVSMVNSVFRVKAEIKAVNEANPKKGIISVYVSAGYSDGVAKGNIFEVFKFMNVAGEEITEKIGELKVLELKNEHLSLCKVTKGGKELQAALDDEIPIEIKTRPSGIFEIF